MGYLVRGDLGSGAASAIPLGAWAISALCRLGTIYGTLRKIPRRYRRDTAWCEREPDENKGMGAVRQYFQVLSDAQPGCCGLRACAARSACFNSISHVISCFSASTR